MNVTSKQCIEFVSDAYGVSVECVTKSGRSMDYVWPRWVAMYLCRNYLSMTLQSIGEKFSGRHHTSVRHALDSMEKAIETDKHIALDVSRIKAAFEKETGLTPFYVREIGGYRMSKYSLVQK